MSESSGPENWQILLLLFAILALLGYAWYRHDKDPNWNPFQLPSPSTLAPSASSTPFE